MEHLQMDTVHSMKQFKNFFDTYEKLSITFPNYNFIVIGSILFTKIFYNVNVYREIVNDYDIIVLNNDLSSLSDEQISNFKNTINEHNINTNNIDFIYNRINYVITLDDIVEFNIDESIIKCVTLQYLLYRKKYYYYNFSNNFSKKLKHGSDAIYIINYLNIDDEFVEEFTNFFNSFPIFVRKNYFKYGIVQKKIVKTDDNIDDIENIEF